MHVMMHYIERQTSLITQLKPLHYEEMSRLCCFHNILLWLFCESIIISDRRLIMNMHVNINGFSYNELIAMWLFIFEIQWYMYTLFSIVQRLLEGIVFLTYLHVILPSSKVQSFNLNNLHTYSQYYQHATCVNID